MPKMLRGCWRLMLFLFVVILLAPLQMLARGGSVPLFFHRVMMWVLNVKISQTGTPAKALLVSNHTSWLDILILGSTAELSFISKKEVASWPLFGQLAILQKTIFVDRENRAGVVESLKTIKSRAKTLPLVLFAEGTTSDGSQVLPFMASLIFPPVQPVVICYEEPSALAWHGDMTLAPHFWSVFKRKETRVRVIFHEVILEGNRKEVATQAEKIVRAGYRAQMQHWR